MSISTPRFLDRRTVLAGLAGTFAAPAPSFAASRSRFALLNPDDIATRVKRPGAPVASIVKRAEAHLAREPRALRRLTLEGRHPGQAAYEESKAATEDFQAILELGLAFTATREDRFLTGADRMIGAWAKTYRPNLNPIDEEKFERLIMGADLVRGRIDPNTDAALDALLLRFKEGYAAAVRPPYLRGTDRNNWQSNRYKLAVMSAYALGDLDEVVRLRDLFDTFLDEHIVTPDGMLQDFRERHAIHYTVYSLHALTLACLATRAHGHDWLNRRNAAGASVATAIDWTVPYMTGRLKNEEFEGSPVAFDRARKERGTPGYSGLWQPGNGAWMFERAAALSPRWRPVLDVTSAAAGRPPSDWMRVILL